MFGSGWGGVFWESTGIREILVVWTGISRSGADKLGSSGTRKAVFRGIWKVSASKPRWNNVTNPIFFFQPPSAAILDWFAFTALFQNRYCDILKVICLDYSPSHNNKHYNDIVPQSCIDSTMLSVYFRKNVMTIQTRQLQSYHLFIWIQVRAKRARRKNWAGISNKLVQTIIKSFEESTNPSKWVKK